MSAFISIFLSAGSKRNALCSAFKLSYSSSQHCKVTDMRAQNGYVWCADLTIMNQKIDIISDNLCISIYCELS